MSRVARRRFHLETPLTLFKGKPIVHTNRTDTIMHGVFRFPHLQYEIYFTLRRRNNAARDMEKVHGDTPPAFRFTYVMEPIMSGTPLYVTREINKIIARKRQDPDYIPLSKSASVPLHWDFDDRDTAVVYHKGLLGAFAPTTKGVWATETRGELFLIERQPEDLAAMQKKLTPMQRGANTPWRRNRYYVKPIDEQLDLELEDDESPNPDESLEPALTPADEVGFDPDEFMREVRETVDRRKRSGDVEHDDDHENDE